MGKRNSTDTPGDDALRRRVAELEAALAASEEQRLEWLRSLSAAGHDMRQPYQAMRLFHHLVMMGLSDPESVEIGTRLGEAIEAAERQLNGLIDYAKAESGRIAPQSVETNLSDLVNAIVHELRPLAKEQGLELRTRVPQGLVARTDPTLFARMVRSLLENAVRFTARGRILVGVRSTRDVLRVEVWDTGPGLEDGQLKMIFEPFVRFPRPEAGGQSGLGLGLPAVRRMADLLGYAVTVRSWPGRGSVFAIAIPASTVIGRRRGR